MRWPGNWERCFRCSKRRFAASFKDCDVCGWRDCDDCRRLGWATATVCSADCVKRGVFLKRQLAEFPPAVAAEVLLGE